MLRTVAPHLIAEPNLKKHTNENKKKYVMIATSFKMSLTSEGGHYFSRERLLEIFKH